MVLRKNVHFFRWLRFAYKEYSTLCGICGGNSRNIFGILCGKTGVSSLAHARLIIIRNQRVVREECQSVGLSLREQKAVERVVVFGRVGKATERVERKNVLLGERIFHKSLLIAKSDEILRGKRELVGLSTMLYGDFPHGNKAEIDGIALVVKKFAGFCRKPLIARQIPNDDVCITKYFHQTAPKRRAISSLSSSKFTG